MTTTYFTDDTYNALREFMKLISNQFADTYLNCHYMVVDGYDYYLLQVKLFGNWVDWI